MKHNLLNTAKWSNEDQTLTNFCLPRWSSKCLDTPELSGEVFILSLRKWYDYILQACPACASTWTEISLGLISTCSVLTSISPDRTPDWPGLWVKWWGFCFQSNMWRALGGCTVSLGGITVACPNTRQENVVVHPPKPQQLWEGERRQLGHIWMPSLKCRKAENFLTDSQLNYLLSLSLQCCLSLGASCVCLLLCRSVGVCSPLGCGATLGASLSRPSLPCMAV